VHGKARSIRFHVDCSAFPSRAIIQSGIKKIFVHQQFYQLSTRINREKWIGHDDITMQMFDEANVELGMLDLPDLRVDAYLDGLVYHLGC
jgi:deoxycytidylate deaminase